MDDYVLNLVNDEQFELLENLLVAGYDHVLDITGLRRNRVVNARDIAVLKEFKDIIEMLDDWQHYQVRVWYGGRDFTTWYTCRDTRVSFKRLCRLIQH